MSRNPTTVAALRRKIARLEAQLAAYSELITRDRTTELQTIRRAADMRVRMEQAVQILTGKDDA